MISSHKLVILASLMAATASIGTAKSNVLPAFSQPTGYGMESSVANGTPMYGFTATQPNWAISQWNIPQQMPPLLNTPATQLWTSQNAYGEVVINAGAPIDTVTLSQSGHLLPCNNAGGAPLEFNLLFQANHNITTAPEVSSWLGDTAPQELPDLILSNMTALEDSGTFKIDNMWLPANTPACPVNQGNALITVVLSNTSVQPVQTFFYEIVLAFACPVGSPASCSLRPKNGYWWYDGLPVKNTSGTVSGLEFGFSDTLPEYGYPIIENTSLHSLQLNLLPRLTQIIQQGSYGMDTNLSHWTVNGMNNGQNIWGAMGLASDWTGFVPTVQTASTN